MKVPFDAIAELGRDRALVLASIVNRLPVSPHGLSIGAIADDLRLSWRQALRYVLGLEAAGYIVIEREAGKVGAIDLSISTRDKLSGVLTNTVRGRQIQTPDKLSHDKEENERSKDRAAIAASSSVAPGDGERPLAAKGDTPFANPRPGMLKFGAKRPREAIADLLRVARGPSSDVIPIAAQVEREAKKRRDDAWARANGFTTIGGPFEEMLRGL